MQYLNKKCEKFFDRNILEWRLNIRGRVCDQNIKLFSVVFRFSAQTLPAHVQTLQHKRSMVFRAHMTQLTKTLRHTRQSFILSITPYIHVHVGDNT